MSWIRDLINPNARTWEEFYRNRWQHDRVVRSTHGVNCTGSCSWMIYVKDGIVTWEMQATDYPTLEAVCRDTSRAAAHVASFSPGTSIVLFGSSIHMSGECCWIRGEKRGPGMPIQWRLGRRLWTIRPPAVNIRRPEGGAASEERVGMSPWRSWLPHCSTPRRNTGRTEWPASLRFPLCRCSATRRDPAFFSCSALLC